MSLVQTMIPFIVLPIALFVNVGASRPQSINLELETVFEFDKANDLYFLKNILNKINDILTSNTKKKGLKRQSELLTVTDFLKRGLPIIKSLKDNDLRYIFRRIRNEIQSFDTEDSFEEDLRKFVNHKLDDFSRDPKKLRSNLDDLLQKTQTNKINRKRELLLNFMNNIYKKEYDSRFSNYLNKIDIFRRNSKGTKDELKRIVRTIIRDILSKYANLRKNNKQMFKTLIEDYLLLDDEMVNTISTEKDKDEVSSSAKEEAKEEEDVKEEEAKDEEDKKDTYTTKVKQKKRTKTSKKLTHITLYPSIEVRQKKSKFRTDSVKSKSPTKYTSHDISHSKTDIENVAFNYAFANVSSDSKKKDIKEIYGDKNRDGQERTDVEKSEALRQTKYSENSDITSSKRSTKMEEKERSSLESFEHFGSLYRMKNTKVSRKMPTNLMRSTKNDIFNTIENKTSTIIKEEDELFNDNVYTSSIYLHRRANKPFGNTNKTNIKLNYDNTTNNYNNIINKASKEIQTRNKINEKEELEKSSATTVFDVNKFIKNSQIQNIEDTEKKKEIEKKMKEDLFFLLSTTNATTEAYTDVFKDLEDAFNIS